MREYLQRSARLVGQEALDRLEHAKVAVFGIGGVGSYAAEALARGGVGHLTLIDSDEIALSNLNRQLFATADTVGEPKVEVAAKRLALAAPGVQVEARQMFFVPESEMDFSEYDYVLDCIDSVSGKIELAVRCAAQGVPLIAAMGAGNKLDASAFEVADLAKTSVCPLAKVMRTELRKRGITHLKVVYSQEPPIKLQPEAGERRATPGSMSYVPGVMGMIMAGEVIKDLIIKNKAFV
ncbi:MAG: tRNA threonylcarbamoyladenosine dehydratase [Clostridia bacterium]|nr:tRNA threonylcarbamoyladenosine dehydratase [Clostridia bacterium]